MAEPKPERTTWTRVVENMAAVVMLFAGIASLGGLIAALAGGFEGWVIVAAIAVVVLFAGAFFLFKDGAKRRAREAGTVVYAPDDTTDTFDIDPNTGNRTLRRE